MSEELVEMESEKELYELEKYINDIWQFLPIPIVYVSSRGTVLDTDTSLENLLEYPKEELIGRGLSDFCFPTQEILSVQQQTLEGKSVNNRECILKNKSGREIPVLLSTLTRRDEEGNAIGFFAAFFDITEVRRTQKQLDEKVKELEQSEDASLNIMDDLQEIMENLEKTKKHIELQNIKLKKLDRIKSDFLNVTSHELRTPMSAIKGYTQMVMKQTLGDITEEQEKALNIVLRNTERLDHLIQDILDISRLESGTMKFIPEKTDIKNMLEETVETMQSSADLKHITITGEMEDMMPELTIDQERVKQVIINIISNAIKFSPDGSIINIRAKKDKNNILFEIQDFGRGIPEDKQKKIFETFYQVDSGMDRKFGGAGLGLAISRGIVLTHGGQIWTNSIVGKGSTFYFTLPIRSVVDLEEKFKGIDVFGLGTGGI
jgi:PAS domain S-box-containing protein